MNQAHLHLLLNHIPIVGILIGTLICVVTFFFKDHSIRRIALGIFIFSAAVAIPAYLTGEGAGEVVEDLPGIIGSSIETHEDIALIFIWLISALGITALIALVTDIVKKNYAAKFIYVATLVLSLVVLVKAYQLGNSGGEIRHNEIRTGAQSNFIEEVDSD
ncbi:MAG TPA: hypothetical protein VE978_07760 [Chitinophagales bacterium]|nr:hypothetical protein [Chitinophagales bacterium]